MRIPVQNLYFLFCYAWDYFPASPMSKNSAECGPDVPHLLSRLLIAAVHDAQRRGLLREYIVQEEATVRMRGRLLLTRSIREDALSKGRLYCQFDEFERDSLANQIIRSTLNRLVMTEQLDGDTRAQVRDAMRSLEFITIVPLTRDLFRRVRVPPSHRIYFVLMDICRMLYDCLLAQEQHGSYRFRDVLEDTDMMWRIFQRFIRRFYELEQRDFAVSSDRLKWTATATDGQHLAYLPVMNTDVSLRSHGKTIVIECKYYPETLQKAYATQTVHSGHLYQLFAYLKNLEVRSQNDLTAEGVLLYPRVGSPLDLTYEIQGHSLRVLTIDLAQDWTAIRADLLKLTQLPETAMST